MEYTKPQYAIGDKVISQYSDNFLLRKDHYCVMFEIKTAFRSKDGEWKYYDGKDIIVRESEILEKL